MIIYYLYLNVECFLMYAENFSILKNTWPISLKIWVSRDPPHPLREKVLNLSIYLNYGTPNSHTLQMVAVNDNFATNS